MMLQINLLPEDQRVQEGIPIKLVGVAAAAIAVNVVALLGLMALLGSLGDVEADIARIQGDIQALKPVTDAYAEATERLDVIEARKEAVVWAQEQKDPLWSEVFDALTDVWDEHGRNVRLTAAYVYPADDNPQKPDAEPERLELEFYVAGDRIPDLTAFRKAIRDNEKIQGFFDDFQPPDVSKDYQTFADTDTYDTNVVIRSGILMRTPKPERKKPNRPPAARGGNR